ncbi:hypothetical protein FE257_001021 [Aspergillus nanangensis]|uniref:Carrier domain-containing protein n=1 Tax=Aspergillus nanangensis TaxID=2582783 RepID=A0AAD4GWC6_ASPNN|nr:hypothetical protein FE257_001021 [Aspergillus nanangensis]
MRNIECLGPTSSTRGPTTLAAPDESDANQRAIGDVVPVEYVRSGPNKSPSYSKRQEPYLNPPLTSPGERNLEHDRILHELAARCGCSVADIDDFYPCTPLQEGMMAATSKNPTAYTIENDYRLPVEMDTGRLEEAWNQTAQANPILRTRVVTTGERGCLQVVICGSIQWEVLPNDEDGNPNATASATWKEGAPLVRWTLNASQRMLRMTIHHTICDHWSIALLPRQVDTAYRGEKLDNYPFRPLVEYIDRTRSQAEAFWTKHFDDAHPSTMKTFPSLPLSGNAARPTEKVQRTFDINTEMCASVAINTKLRLSWAILQSVYTGSSDTMFGAVDAGRSLPVPGIQELSGPTIATVPVRIQLRQEDTISMALTKVQAQWAESMEFVHVGLQSLLRLGPGPNAACQFQTLMSVEPMDGHQSPGIFSHHSSVQDTYDLYPFILRCRPSKHTLWIEAAFDPAILEVRQAERLLCQFIHIYGQLGHRPDMTIAEIDPVSAEDLEELTSRNLGPLIDFAPPPCVHELIQQRARQQPSAPAISSWDGNLSYQALDELSSNLAGHLAQCPGRRGTFVPLCIEKSKWMAVAMMAVMKSGSAFLLLDPSHPVSRLRTICETVKATMVVTSETKTELVSKLGVDTIIVADDRLSSRSGATLDSSDSSLSSKDPIYATFTSGSTGTPKGLVVHHSGYASSALAHGGPYHITPESRVLQFASPAFDSCIIEHLTTLIFGGCVCVPSAEDCHSHLEDVINRFAITVACLTPTVTRILNPNCLPALEVLVFVGEAVLGSDVARWQPFVTISNAYGPAECSAVFSVQPHLQLLDPANIGFATGGVGWVVHPDDHRRLMPLGSVGELLVEGETVGSGYISNDEQTTQVFVHAPPWRQLLGRAPTRHMYKTGDLVQCIGDGSFRYLGRKDTQVKLHGQRLELGGVEHHLGKVFPQARQVVVEILRTSQDQSHQYHRPDAVLVAFICTSSSSIRDQDAGFFFIPPNDSFRDACTKAEVELLDRVPSFMVPKVFLPILHVPLTASGKTDRRRLREQAALLSWDHMQSYQTSQLNIQVPSTPQEQKLLGIWAHVLNRHASQIGVTDNFFRLGGDSVVAMQLASRCQAAGFPVTVRDIFRHSTVRKLYDKVQETGDLEDVSWGLDDDPTDTWFELSPIQRMFFDHAPAGNNRFTQQFLLRITTPISISSLTNAMNIILSRHSMLRARFECQSDGQWRQMVHSNMSGGCCTRQHSLGALEDEDGLRQILNSSREVVDIVQGPLFIADLINTSNQYQYLSLMGHHLVVDLVSWRVVLQDLEDILSTGQPPSQPASMPFQKWCHLEQSHVKADLDPRKTLPNPIPRPFLNYWNMGSVDNNTWADTAQEDITISRAASERIFGLANDAFHARPVELIQAAMLHAFVGIFDDREAPTIFNEGHGREPWSRIDISRTVGWFTTMAPLFINARKGQKITELIQLTKDGRRAIPSNGFPYFATRYLHPEGRKLWEGHAPMEILFNYTGRFQQLERKYAILQLAANPDHHILPMSPDFRRLAMIDVSASFVDGELNLTFIYNRKMAHVNRLHEWFQGCLDTLEELPRQLADHRQMTVSDFPLLSLSSEKNLESILHAVTSQCDIGVSQIEDIYPCSPIQLGMWLSQVKNPSRPYWSRIRWRFEPRHDDSPPIQLSRVQCAWQHVVNRCPILRTVLIDGVGDNKYPFQVVLKSVNADTRIVSGSDAMIDDASRRSYPDKKGKPPHQLLLSSELDRSVFCELTIHHVLVDGVTRQVLLSELYDACVGQLSRIPMIPYSSYVGYLNDRCGQAPEEYWKKYLEGMQPCLFPWLRDTGASDGPPRLRSTPFVYGIGSQLRSFCRNNGVISSSLFQVAWGMVLRIYTGQDSVCFGYLASGRDIPLDDASSIVGPLTNLLLCRLFLLDDDAVLSVITNNQTAYASSIENQHGSMVEIMHALGLSGQSLFNTAMSIQKQGTDEVCREGSDIIVRTEGGYDSTEYDLILSITTNKEGIHGDLTFWSNMVGDVQAELIMDTFHHVLLQLMDSTNARIGDLDWLGTKNSEHIFQNNKDLPHAVHRCVHEGINDRSREEPRALAIDAWDISFSYEELEDISSSWVDRLLQRGVGPDIFVPVCYDKSGWTVVALLAILKAGGAFILLDPSHPVDRLQSMVQENFDCPVIITSATHRDLAARIVPSTIVIDTHACKLYSELSETRRPLCYPSPSSAAYAIFTSGTTGKPKASVIEHKSFSSAAKSHAPRLRIHKNSRVLQFASVAFDASVVEMLTTLLAGGCICIPNEEDRQNRLGSFINELRVSWALLTPSVARILNPKTLSSLETIVLGGEGMNSDDVRRWQSHVTLINAYGPSECSVISTVQPNSRVLRNEWSNIGWPTGGACWVVSPGGSCSPLPVGAVGELLIDGPIVGRGYVNRPEVTAASFIPYPPWIRDMRDQRGVLYRTSDLVRQLPDGSFRYVGRQDRQVKLRGVRIELSEVEYHVQRCFPGKGVEVFVDLVTEKRDNKPHLVASIVQSPTSSRTQAFYTAIAQTRGRMMKEVPKFFMPSVFVHLTELPRLVNGKTDRCRIQHGAVEALKAQMDKTDGPHKTWKPAELTEEERTMQKLWSDVLGSPKECIGPKSNFFQLGGDSIAAMRLASAAGVVGLNLAVPKIFLYPELRELAQVPFADGEKQLLTKKSTPHISTAPGTNGLSLVRVENGRSNATLQGGKPTLTGEFPSAEFARDRIELGADVNIQRVKPARGPRNIANDIPYRAPEKHTTFSLVAEGQRGTILSKVSSDLVQNNVDDILPTPEFQSITINNSSLVALAELFPGSVDLDRLYRACKNVVAHHSILRTIFVAHDDRLFQVVLRNIITAFKRVRVEDPAGYLAQASREKMEWTSVEGHVQLQFTAVVDYTGDHWGLVIRLSHGQFDPPSLSLLWQSIAEAYSGQSLPRSVPFKEVVYHRLGQEHHDALTFWRHYLRDVAVSATGLGNTGGLKQSEGDGGVMNVQCEVDGLRLPADITMATLVQGAIAWMLSGHLALSEVVLGQISHGRRDPIANHEQVLGPCSTTLPLRIGVDPTWTAAEFLEHVQSQRLIAGTYDSVPWERVVDRCTTWLKETLPGCVVNHHTLLERTEGMEFAGVQSCWSRTWAQAKPSAGQLAVISVERGSRLELHLKAREEVMNTLTGSRWIDALKSTITAFCLRPHQGLNEHMIPLDLL